MHTISGIVNDSQTPVDALAEQALLRGPPYAQQEPFIFRAPGVLLVQHAVRPLSRQRATPIEDDRYVTLGDADLASVLALYRRHGDDCLSLLDGEFGFALWDKRERRLFCAIDHFGARALFYAQQNGRLTFSSDLEMVTSASPTERRFDAMAIAEAFLHDYSGATYDSDVRALPGGSSLTRTASTVRERKYWQLQPTGKYSFGRDEEWADCLRELLTRAVRRRLDTDEPVGVLLSGGIDSSFVAAVAARVLAERNRGLIAFSNVLPEDHDSARKDERQWIDTLRRSLPNLEQRWITPAPDVGPLTGLATTFSRAHAIANPFHYIDAAQFKAAQDLGVGVLLAGHGGDYTISYRGDKPRMAAWRVFRHWLTRGDARAIRRELPLSQGLRRTLLERGYYTRKSHRERVADYVGSGSAGIHYNQLRSVARHYAVEYCMPIWDRDILEFYMDVPTQQFALGGVRRSLARRAMAGLVPDEIRDRPDKVAFAPDHHARLQRQRKEIQALLELAHNAPAEKYVDARTLQREMDELLETPNPPERKTVLLITVFVIAFTGWLEERGYRL